MALRYAPRPMAATYLFRTHYPPATWTTALGETFSVTNPLANLAATPFIGDPATSYPAAQRAREYNPVAILLGWPEDNVPSNAFIDPSSLTKMKLFRGRGLAIWKSGFWTFSNGTLVADPIGALATMECRKPKASDASIGRYFGHAQHDQNAITIFYKGRPLFYDSGYSGFRNCQRPYNEKKSFMSEGHNAMLVNGIGTDMIDADHRFGTSMSVTSGSAIYYLTGDNSRAWSKDCCHGDPGCVTPECSLCSSNSACNGSSLVPSANAIREVTIMEHSGQPPSFYIDDDLYVPGVSNPQFAWLWHAPTDTGFGIADPQTGPVEWEDGLVGAHLDLLSGPQSISQSSFTPSGNNSNSNYTHWPTHKRLSVQYDPAGNSLVQQSDLYLYDVGQPRPSDVSDAVIVSGGPARARKVLTNGALDVIITKALDSTGTIVVDVDGHIVKTDAHNMVLRFSGSVARWEDITSGLLANGSRVSVDDYLVVSLKSTTNRGTVTFGPDLLTMDGEPAEIQSCWVGPFFPATMQVNGVEQPVVMTPMMPHPQRSVFPVSVGRSPKNNTVPSGYRYRLSVVLKDGGGTPIEKWTNSRMPMDIAAAAGNGSTGNLPVHGLGDVAGKWTYAAGLNTGGSYADLGGGDVVTIWIDYFNDGTFYKFRTFSSISSPDENGDGVINATDETTFNAAFNSGSPLHEGDMNPDGAIGLTDVTWYQQHAAAP